MVSWKRCQEMLWIDQQLDQSIYWDSKYILLIIWVGAMLWSLIWPPRSSEDRTVMFGHFHHWENWNKQHRFLCTCQENCLRTFEKEKKNCQIECFKSKSSNTRTLRNLCTTFADTTNTQSAGRWKRVLYDY